MKPYPQMTKMTKMTKMTQMRQMEGKVFVPQCKNWVSLSFLRERRVLPSN